ncbi:MAG: methyltransferase domain-containing protein [Lachnospiraceae bacterium]|nr:methyltransferase domain-containing protein [Lachnospiraceae bacterium]
MSKYDFEMTLSQNTSTGIILNRVEKGSVVLEFGCATGRMTRYMKENLGCRVYIVEYDQSAYETALQYAEDGLCDDIMHFRWAEKFEGIVFDAIVFADVLEHLTSPEKVLECAAKLLKDDGQMYVSVPNITHNDILLKAYAEHFDYTETGLLDDTHVHFWGMENIGTLAAKSGLHIRTVEGTYCATGDTEQYAQSDRNENRLLENILKERKCGEVYQFVVTLDKDEGGESTYSFKAPSLRSHIYLDKGNDFNAESVIGFDSVYSGDGSYIAHYEVENTGDIRRIRLDPVEFQSCILRGMSMRQGDEELTLIIPDGGQTEKGILLCGEDPMVYAEVLLPDEPIIIDAEIILPGAGYIEVVESAYADKHSAFENLRRDTDVERGQLHRTMNELSEVNAGLAAVKVRLENEIAVMTGEKAGLESEIAALTGENQGLKNRIEELTGENQGLKNRIEELAGENQGLKNRIEELTGDNQSLRNEIVALTGEKQCLESEIASLLSEKTHLENERARLIGEKAALENRIAALTAEGIELHGDIDAYTVLMINKEKYIISLENELKEYRGIEKYVRIIKRVVSFCRNLKFAGVRVRAFIPRALRGIKRRVKRVLDKEESV